MLNQLLSINPDNGLRYNAFVAQSGRGTWFRARVLEVRVLSGARNTEIHYLPSSSMAEHVPFWGRDRRFETFKGSPTKERNRDNGHNSYRI